MFSYRKHLLLHAATSQYGQNPLLISVSVLYLCTSIVINWGSHLQITILHPWLVNISLKSQCNNLHVFAEQSRQKVERTIENLLPPFVVVLCVRYLTSNSRERTNPRMRERESSCLSEYCVMRSIRLSALLRRCDLKWHGTSWNRERKKDQFQFKRWRRRWQLLFVSSRVVGVGVGSGKDFRTFAHFGSFCRV